MAWARCCGGGAPSYQYKYIKYVVSTRSTDPSGAIVRITQYTGIDGEDKLIATTDVNTARQNWYNDGYVSLNYPNYWNLVFQKPYRLNSYVGIDQPAPKTFTWYFTESASYTVYFVES